MGEEEVGEKTKFLNDVMIIQQRLESSNTKNGIYY